MQGRIRYFHPYAIGVTVALLTLSLSAVIWLREQKSFSTLLQVRADFRSKKATDDLSARIRSLQRMARRLATFDEVSGEFWKTDTDSYRFAFKDLDAVYFLNSDFNVREKNSSLKPSEDKQFLLVANKKINPGESVVFPWKEKGKILILVPVLRGRKNAGYVMGIIDTVTHFSDLGKLPFSLIEVVAENGTIYSTLERSNYSFASKWIKEAKIDEPLAQFKIFNYPTQAALHDGLTSVSWITLVAGLIISALFTWIIVLIERVENKRQAALYSNRRLEALLEFAPVGIIQANELGGCIQVNRSWREITGLSEEASQENGWQKQIHPEDREQVKEQWEKAINDGGLFNCEFRLLPPGGNVVWLQGKGTMVRDSSGKVISYLGAFLDITHVRLIGATLREKEAFLSAIVDHLPIALFCKDAYQDFQFTLLNRKAEEICGFTFEQMKGKSVHELFPGPEADFFRQKDLETMASGKAVNITEEPLTTGGKNEIIVRTIKVPVKDGAGNPRYLLGISEDITEQKKMEKIVEEQRIRLAYVDKMSALGEMAAGIGHEINNPLTIIGGNAAQLKKLLVAPELDRAKLEKASSTILSTVERVARIINGLQTFSRDGESDPLESVSIKELTEEALGFCRGRFGKRGVKVTLAGIEDSGLLRCRRVQLSQVLLNLMNNAFYATKDQKSALIDISSEDRGDEVRITVTDSGPRIPDDVAGKLMQPFFTTKGVGKGTGLGLCISNNIVESHGGRLYLDREHQNTRFVVVLPKIPPPAMDYQGSSRPV